MGGIAMNLNAQLTKREAQIAEMIAWGAAKKEIANALFISERTTENHTRNIYEKTGVGKSNELSAWWFCSRFKISLDLSPMNRKVGSLILLAIFTISLCNLNINYIRTRGSRRQEQELEIII